MSDEIKKIKNIEQSILKTNWNEICKSYNREEIFIINNQLNLEEVAFSMIENRSAQIKEWINNGLLSIPLPEEEIDFKEKNLPLNYLFISPYCLIKLILT